MQSCKYCQFVIVHWLQRAEKLTVLDHDQSFLSGEVHRASEKKMSEENKLMLTRRVELWERRADRKSTRLNSSHVRTSRMPSSA